jgi:hypothetical protein
VADGGEAEGSWNRIGLCAAVGEWRNDVFDEGAYLALIPSRSPIQKSQRNQKRSLSRMMMTRFPASLVVVP